MDDDDDDPLMGWADKHIGHDDESDEDDDDRMALGE